MNKLFTVIGGKFKISAQNSALEYEAAPNFLTKSYLNIHSEQKISILEKKISVSGIVFDTVIMAAKAKIIQGLLKVMAICQAF